MIEAKDSDFSCLTRLVFMNIYLVFGKIVRPFYVDFIGPFLPFLSMFMLIRDENDAECARMKIE